LLLTGFLGVYVACAIGAQALASIQRSISPSEEGAPIEAFTSGLLWIIAMYGVIRITESLATGRRLFFWLAFTAALGALAVDEILGIHEATEPGFNDDWVKIAMWIATPFLLGYLSRIERAERASRIAMVIGFAIHSAYIFVETGDGEIFDLGVTLDVLKWSEEVFELLFLAAYTWALWTLVLRQHVPSSNESLEMDPGIESRDHGSEH